MSQKLRSLHYSLTTNSPWSDSEASAPLDLGTQLDQLLAEVLLLGLVLDQVVPDRGAALRQRCHRNGHRHPLRGAEICIFLGTCTRQ